MPGKSSGSRKRNADRQPQGSGDAGKSGRTAERILAGLDSVQLQLSELSDRPPQVAPIDVDALLSNLKSKLESENSEAVLTAIDGQRTEILQVAESVKAVHEAIRLLSERIDNTPDLTAEVHPVDLAVDDYSEKGDSASEAAPIGDATGACEETSEQSWEDIKRAMLGEAKPRPEAEVKPEEEQVAEQVQEDTSIDVGAFSESDLDQMSECELRSLILDRERVVSELARRLQRQVKASTQVTPDELKSAAENLPDDVREKIETTLKAFNTQARLGELELSLERARISRQLSQLEETKQKLHKKAEVMGVKLSDEGAVEGDLDRREKGSKGRRWLGALGFRE